MVGWRCGHRASLNVFIEWLINWLSVIEWFIDLLVDKLIDWLIIWAVGWLIDWIVEVVLRIGIPRRTVLFNTTLLWRKLIYREEKGNHFIQNYDTNNMNN